MKFLVCSVFLIIATVGISVNGVAGSRSKRQIPITAGTYIPDGTELTIDGVPVLRRPYSRAPVHYPGPQALEHYTSFVNDPYVNTEDLASLIGSRPRPQQQTSPQPRPRRPELRSGYESSNNDRDRIRWSAGQQAQSAQFRELRPYNPSQPRQDSQDGQQRGSRYQTNTNTYQRTHYGGGGGNDEWEVESKGDNHITYRRRITTTETRRWDDPPRIQRFDTQHGQVSARVVDMRTSDDTSTQNRRRQQQQAGAGGERRAAAGSRRRVAQEPRPETRSLDSTTTYRNPSIFPTDTTSSTGNNNINDYWSRQRTGGASTNYGSSSSSSSVWPSTYSASSSSNNNDNNYQSRRTSSVSSDYYRNQNSRPAPPRFEPNYPTLYDKETSDRVGVQNRVVITV